MKHSVIILLLIPLISLGEKVTVKGKISDFSGGTIQLNIDKNYLNANPESYSDKSKDGKFDFSFELEKPETAILIFKDNVIPLFLEPGDELTVSVLEKSYPNGTEFSGKGGANNNFLFDFNLKFGDSFDAKQIQSLIQSSDVDQFEMKIYDNRKQQQDYYNEYPDRDKLTASFKAYVENQIAYQYYASLLAFPIWKDQTGDGLSVSPLPSIMLEGVSKLEIINDRNMLSSAYRHFLLNYITYYTANLNSFQKFENQSDLLDRKYNLAMKGFKGEPFKYTLAQNLYDFCGSADPATVKKLFNALSDADTEQAYVKIISDRCGQQINAREPKREKGEDNGDRNKKSSSPPPFELVDMEGNPVSFDDFRGKVVYVDFWASWCGPCRQQFPHSKELHEKFTKQQLKDIVFLYISIDNTADIWKNAVQNLGLEGFNALSPGGWSSGAARYFQVTSIPRYMLIDKRGNIVDPNAKRPSTGEEIYRDILKLLE